MASTSKFDDEKLRDAFLRVYEATGRMQAGADAVNTTVPTIKRYADTHGFFAAQIVAAKERFIGTLEDEAYRRAMQGDVECRYDKEGNLTSEKTVRSDRLMELLLKRHRKAEYANAVSVDARVDAKVTTMPVDVDSMTEEQRAALRAFCESFEDLPE